MKYRRARRGTTLMEIMAAVFVLGLTALIAGAFFPLSAAMRDRSGYHSRAAAVILRKLEQVRRLDPDQLTHTNLQSLGMVDAAGGFTAGSTGFHVFTTTDRLSDQFRQPIGYLVFTGLKTDLVRADIYVSWLATNGKRYIQKTTTYVADKTTWKEPAP